jgi:serine phosphatase RsbU (regulator of sigma subunit)
VWVPLAEGSERLGVLELTHSAWSEEQRGVLDPVVRVLVLVLISKRRYTDVVLRGRRAQPLSIAAEIQWALLPPLTYSSSEASVSGILEPAYSIGGDSFDYALNPGRGEFAIVDAVGHGISAVSISVLALNSLRNARREGHSLERAYLDAGEAIESQFGGSSFATGQIGQLELDTGHLTWLNAGHPLPLLVRDRSFVRELSCRPSLPMGLGGGVDSIATDKLQPGDRVLFYTDGVVESRSPDGERFGMERLADHVVRTATAETSPAETVRRLAAAVLAYNGRPLRDDATLLLLEYHGSPNAVGVGDGP